MMKSINSMGGICSPLVHLDVLLFPMLDMNVNFCTASLRAVDMSRQNWMDALSIISRSDIYRCFLQSQTDI